MEERNFRLIDLDNQLFTITAEVYDGHLSISGVSGKNCGQCYDEIVPTAKQGKLVKFWKEYHLKHEFPEQELTNIIDDVIDEYNHRIKETEQLFDVNDEKQEKAIQEYIVKEYLYSEHEANCIIGVLRYMNLPLSEIVNIERDYDYDDWCVWYILGYTVYADYEENLENCVRERLECNDDLYVEAVKNGYRESFDTWVDEAVDDGIAHTLNSYDESYSESDINYECIYVCQD